MGIGLFNHCEFDETCGCICYSCQIGPGVGSAKETNTSDRAQNIFMAFFRCVVAIEDCILTDKTTQTVSDKYYGTPSCSVSQIAEIANEIDGMFTDCIEASFSSKMHHISIIPICDYSSLRQVFN